MHHWSVENHVLPMTMLRLTCSFTMAAIRLLFFLVGKAGCDLQALKNLSAEDIHDIRGDNDPGATAKH